MTDDPVEPPHPPYPPGSGWAALPGTVPMPGMYPVPARPRGDPVPVTYVMPLAGTPFGLAIVAVPPVTSGPAIGSMIAGIGSILVALVTLCLGLSGGPAGWGALVAGAFAILSVLLGGAALATGIASVRTIRKAVGTLKGRGMARAGVVCGSIGLGLAVLGFTGALIVTLAS